MMPVQLTQYRLLTCLLLVLLWTSVGWAFIVHIQWPSSEHRGGSWSC